MIDLKNPNISYIVLSSNKIDDMASILYAKNYTIIPLQSYYKGIYENSLIAFGFDNDEIRKDLIFLLEHFKENNGIIKYIGEDDVKRVMFDGSEKPLDIQLYNTNENYVSYIHEGVSFSFIDGVRYWKPNKKEDFKMGMIIEYLNNNKWFKKEVKNPNDEYDKLYKLLMKYDKIRISV